MPVDDSKFIHIVGLYKCGTSWLSHIMGAHPAIISWREFDIIRATHNEQHYAISWRIAHAAARLLKLPPPKLPETHFLPKSKEEVIREIFCGRGWMPMMGEEIRAKANALDYSDSDQFIGKLLNLSGKTLRLDDAPLLVPECHSGTLGVVNTCRKDLVSLLDKIKQSKSIAQTPNHFFQYLQDQCEPGTRIVLKAADQLVSLAQLQQISPHSTKVAIIRDGRDASISAMHYRKLMQKRDAPWARKETAYLDQLRAWTTRARMLANWAEKNQITILRYEDFHRDFFGTCGELFEAMELPVSQELLEDIYQKTNFQAVSGGRKPGEATEHTIRKGIVGEWRSALDAETADLAWKIAGRELERFGYRES